MKPATTALAKGLILVVACTALAAGGVWWNARLATQARALERLKTSSEAVHDLADHAWEVLRLRGQALAGDSAFVDYVTQSMQPDPNLGGVDKLSISDLLHEHRQGDDTLVLLDAEGAPVTAIGVTGKERGAIQHDPLVIAAITQLKTTQGIWTDNGQTYWVVITPLMRGRTPQGYLITAARVTDAFFAKLARLAHSDIAVVTDLSARPVLYSGNLDVRFSELMAAHRDALLAVTEGSGQAEALKGDALDVPVWVTPLGAAQGHVVVVALDQGASINHGIDDASTRLEAGVGLFGLFGILCVVIQWLRTWRPLGRLAQAFDTNKGAMAQVRGSALVRDIRDRLLLAVKPR